MNDIVWVAFVSAGGALAAAITTQFLSTRTAAKQAERAERQEALQWQRSEAKRKRDIQEARLLAFWTKIRLTHDRTVDLQAGSAKGASDLVAVSASPVSAAADAHAIALLGLRGIEPLAKEFHSATVAMQMAIEFKSTDVRERIIAWRACLDNLEAAVANEQASLDS